MNIFIHQQRGRNLKKWKYDKHNLTSLITNIRSITKLQVYTHIYIVIRMRPMVATYKTGSSAIRAVLLEFDLRWRPFCVTSTRRFQWWLSHAATLCLQDMTAQATTPVLSTSVDITVRWPVLPVEYDNRNNCSRSHMTSDRYNWLRTLQSIKARL